MRTYVVIPAAQMSAAHEKHRPCSTSGGEYKVVPWATGSTAATPV